MHEADSVHDLLSPLSSSGRMESKLSVALPEILKYPYLLLHRRLGVLFVKALLALEKCRRSLEVEEKLPGVYLLLLHPDQQVSMLRSVILIEKTK